MRASKDTLAPPLQRAASFPVGGAGQSKVIAHAGQKIVFGGPPPPLIPPRTNKAAAARIRMREQMREEELRRLEHEDRVEKNTARKDPRESLLRAQMELETRYAPPRDASEGFFG
eukprot:2079894-Rhodomonas_salina.3